MKKKSNEKTEDTHDYEFNLVSPDKFRKEITDILELKKEGISEDQFKWKYEMNPLGSTRVWSAWNKKTGEIAGVFSAFKRKFIYKDNILTVYQQTDAKVRGKYRRKGIFTRLINNMNLFLKNKGVLFHFGYTNIHSANVFSNFVISKELYHSFVLISINGTENIIRNQLNLKGIIANILISLTNPFVKIFNRIWQHYYKKEVVLEKLYEFDELPEKWSFETAKKHIFFPLRDKQFLEWKTFNAPLKIKKNILTFWFIKNNRKMGYCILINDRERNLLKILDINCEDFTSNLTTCFKTVKDFAITNRYDTVITNIASNIFIDSAKSAGFLKIKPVRCNIFFLQKNPIANNKSFWFQSPIDRDNFYY